MAGADICSFLKRRILPRLSHEGLITISPDKNDHGQFKFRLANPPATPGWSPEQHWSQLIAGAPPSALAGEHKRRMLALAEERITQRNLSPEQRADPRAVMNWMKRAEGLSVKLERQHLNVRRGNARPGKERARIAAEQKLYKRLDARDARSGSTCLLYTSPSPRDGLLSRMPSSA